MSVYHVIDNIVVCINKHIRVGRAGPDFSGPDSCAGSEPTRHIGVVRRHEVMCVLRHQYQDIIISCSSLQVSLFCDLCEFDKISK